VRVDLCRWWYLLISIIAAILFTAFLIYDLQMLMGGGAREVSPDEYIFAAANIYLDIVQIFLNVLNIVSFAQG
jgi:protein lifeguard